MTADFAQTYADPALSLIVRRHQPMRHPLAQREGIARFEQMLAALQAWKSMTHRQRDLIGTTCHYLGVDAADGDHLEPPELPASTRAATVASLRRKHLVVPDGLRLTPLAVLAAAHGPRLTARGVDTITPTGDHL